MPVIDDVTLTTTLFGPVSLMGEQETGVGRALAEWLKPTITVKSEYLGDHDIAIWGKATPIKGLMLMLIGVGLFFLFRGR